MRFGIGTSICLGRVATAAAPSFDPATLSLTGWWRTDYAASPWTSTASAGASSGRTASEATNPPSVGAAINGYNPADFDGTNDKLSTTVLESDLFTASAGSFAILYYADTTDAANGTPTDDEALFAGAGGYVMATVNNTGARVVLYDTGNKSIQLAGGGAGAWHLLQAKWDGTNLKARLDSGAWTSLACGNMGDLTSTLNIGCNHNATAFFDGRIAEIITAASTLSDATFDDLVAYMNDRYGRSL